VLHEMLDSHDRAFALSLAVLANRREFLNLQTWLPGAIAADSTEVVNALTALLDRRMGGESAALALAPVTIKQIAAVQPAGYHSRDGQCCQPA
jgi:CCR4-NOT transcription complex subunit 1 HEAT repeat